MQKRKISWNLIVRFLEEENSPEEKHIMRQWIASDPEHEEFMIYMKEIWSSDAEVKEEWDVDAAWHRFQMKYREELSEEKAATDPTLSKNKRIKNDSFRMLSQLRRRRISPMARWGSVAAAVAAIFVILFLVYHPVNRKSVKTEKVAMRTIVCPNGQRVPIKFSDGSRVVLNGGSKLTIPKTFSKRVRRVQLSGEAFFKVVHNPRRPFIIVTNHAKIRDLGTRFVVKAYPGNSKTMVAVIEGQVNLRSKRATGGPGALITTLHKGLLHKNKINLSAIKDSSAYVGWVRGNLVFNNDALAKVITKLERRYGINVKAGDAKLLKRKFTGRFISSQSLDEVLDAIALSLNISYSKNDSTITFHSKNKK